MNNPGSPQGPFDVAGYWGRRHKALAGLRATGTLGAPASWQRWLYKGKMRAYLRGFGAVGFRLSGSRVLNFGCGNGYFEDQWESHGAALTSGIDIVEDVINDLRARFPDRIYRSGDLAEQPELLSGLGQFDMVTALDVLYHVVDDRAVERVVGRLSDCLSEQGWFLFTDALADSRPAQHVRFRGLGFWQSALRASRLEVVHREPVFILQNRPGRIAAIAPPLAGSLAYWGDSLLSRIAPHRANNFAIFCRRVRT